MREKEREGKGRRGRWEREEGGRGEREGEGRRGEGKRGGRGRGEGKEKGEEIRKSVSNASARNEKSRVEGGGRRCMS